MRRPLHALMLVCALLGGCSTLAKLVPGHVPKAGVKGVRVAAQPGANLDSSTRLDLVFVYDSSHLQMLPKTAPEWFAQKDALVNGMGQAIDIVSLQVPPGKLLGPGTDPVELPRRHAKAVTVYAYANYLAGSGQARIDLSGYRQPVLWLEPTRVTVTEP